MENNECLFCKKRWETKHISHCDEFKKVLNNKASYSRIPEFYSRNIEKFINFARALKILFYCEKFRKSVFETVPEWNSRCKCLFCEIRLFFCKILETNSSYTETISFEGIENSKLSTYADNFVVESVMDALNILLKGLERLECSKKLKLASFFNLQLSTTFKCLCRKEIKTSVSKFSLTVLIKDPKELLNQKLFRVYQNSSKQLSLKLCRDPECRIKTSWFQDEKFEEHPEYIILEIGCSAQIQFNNENFDFELKIEAENSTISHIYSIYLIEASNQNNENLIYRCFDGSLHTDSEQDLEIENIMQVIASCSLRVNLVIYRKNTADIFEINSSVSDRSLRTRPKSSEKFNCIQCGHLQVISNNKCLKCPKNFNETCKECKNVYHLSLKTCPYCEKSKNESSVSLSQEAVKNKCRFCNTYQQVVSLICSKCRTVLNKVCDNCRTLYSVDCEFCPQCHTLNNKVASPLPKQDVKQVKCEHCKVFQPLTNKNCKKCDNLLRKICQVCRKEYSISLNSCPHCEQSKLNKNNFTSSSCPTCGNSVVNGRRCKICSKSGAPVKVFNIMDQALGQKTNGVYKCSNCGSSLKSQSEECRHCSVPMEEKAKIPLKHNNCQVCNKIKDSDVCRNCEEKYKTQENLRKSYNPNTYSDLINYSSVENPHKSLTETTKDSVGSSILDKRPGGNCLKCFQYPCSCNSAPRRSSSISQKMQCSLCTSILSNTEKRNCGNCKKKMMNAQDSCNYCKKKVVSICDSCLKMKKNLNK